MKRGAKIIDLSGQVFGRWSVVKSSSARGLDRGVLWECVCSCGNIKEVSSNSLRSGKSRSCGCLSREILLATNTTHGLTGTPLYRTWVALKDRCYNKSAKYYKNYGGRGIKVCNKWRESFENFYEDMIGGYKKGLQLDRVNNDKGYSKDNCRWTTCQQNLQNRGSNLKSKNKYKGVRWSSISNKWLARIQKEGKSYHLGLFTCEKEAALAYNERAYELNGEYAYLNKIDIMKIN